MLGFEEPKLNKYFKGKKLLEVIKEQRATSNSLLCAKIIKAFFKVHYLQFCHTRDSLIQ